MRHKPAYLYLTIEGKSYRVQPNGRDFWFIDAAGNYSATVTRGTVFPFCTCPPGACPHIAALRRVGLLPKMGG